jgi:hypothetical protein
MDALLPKFARRFQSEPTVTASDKCHLVRFHSVFVLFVDCSFTAPNILLLIELKSNRPTGWYVYQS